MFRMRLIVICFSIVLFVLFGAPLNAQVFPSKTIRIITSGVGGTTDFMSRLVAQELSRSVGQPVIVDNRASAVITADYVSKTSPDGYTLLSAANSLWIGTLFEKVTYDPVKDFAPITLAVTTPNILVVHPSLPVKVVKDLIALAKSRPGELNYGSSAIGTTSHVAAELFNTMAGIDVVRIPYVGGGATLNALIRGEVHMVFTTPSALPYIKSGRIRALAVTSAKPSILFPGLPTVEASGMPGYESSTGYAILAPARTPDAINNRLNKEIVQILRRDDVTEKFLSVSVEVVGSSPQDLSTTMKLEMSNMARIINSSGIRGTK